MKKTETTIAKLVMLRKLCFDSSVIGSAYYHEWVGKLTLMICSDDHKMSKDEFIIANRIYKLYKD